MYPKSYSIYLRGTINHANAEPSKGEVLFGGILSPKLRMSLVEAICHSTPLQPSDLLRSPLVTHSDVSHTGGPEFWHCHGHVLF